MKYQLANVKLYQSSTLKIVISIWTLLGPKERSVRSIMIFVQVQPYKNTPEDYPLKEIKISKFLKKLVDQLLTKKDRNTFDFTRQKIQTNET